MRDSPKEIDSPLLDVSEEGVLTDLAYDDFSIDPSVDSNNNNRKTIRYIRNDIITWLYISNLLGHYSKKSYQQPVNLKLLDISSKGALISSPKRLRLYKKVKLVLKFEDNKEFEISSKIIRKEVYDPQIYGLKFDQINHGLGDYLVKSQINLVLQDF
jgi:hypothetical protein